MIILFLKYFLLSIVGAHLLFNQTMYSANENDGVAHVGLLLTRPVSDDVVVRVRSSDDTAKGKFTKR